MKRFWGSLGPKMARQNVLQIRCWHIFGCGGCGVTTWGWLSFVFIMTHVLYNKTHPATL